MTRLDESRTTLARSARCVLCVALCAVGCGGSSSETPPPQQPDSTQLTLRKPALPAAAATASAKPADWVWGRYTKAEQTWGTNSPKREPASVPALDAGTPDEL